jgi:apolipoprotein D and lipocalin family protein
MKFRTLAFLLGAITAALADSATELRTVPSVDLNRYVGKWFEIARYPNRFEKACASDVTAQYTLRPNGKIEVVNSCRKADGKIKTSSGSAKIADTQSNAKLKVTFFWPFYGNYWIIDLDPDYRYAVVSEPGRDYLWILSRTPKLEPAVYDAITNRLRQNGFDPSRLIRPVQNAG